MHRHGVAAAVQFNQGRRAVDMDDFACRHERRNDPGREMGEGIVLKNHREVDDAAGAQACDAANVELLPGYHGFSSSNGMPLSSTQRFQESIAR